MQHAMRIAIGVEYDGRGFHGWEAQRHGRTVQQVLDSALARVADAPVRTVCAGRTDARVHALAQVAHFDTQAVRSGRSWVLGANSNLPRDVSVLWAQPMDAAFHARFSAASRSYRYVLLNHAVRPAALHGRVAWESRPLDVDVMARAARELVGEHDYSAFRAAACQARTAVRTVHRLEVWRAGGFVLLDVRANAFLQHMVRNLAGVLIAVGSGKQPVDWAAQVLAGRDRRHGGVTAPAEGLYLTGVDYPPHFAVPRLSPRFALW
jgi:tRNA pseudouridine38-40 synthase